MANSKTSYPMLAIKPTIDDQVDIKSTDQAEIQDAFQEAITSLELYDALDSLEELDESALLGLVATPQNLIPLADREPVTLADMLEGLTCLATMGVVEVTEIVEAIHREILLRPLGRLNKRSLNKWQRGITARIYDRVRKTAKFVGSNLANGLHLYHTIVNQNTTQPLPRRLKPLVNVLNGVMGDHLVNHDNPLATPMVLYNSQGEIPNEALSGRLIVLCHGLCMSHLSWHPSDPEGLGKKIERSISGTTVLYLDYNSGQRISINGRDLSYLLKNVLDNHPNITQIDLIGHSMGGLVARSALFYGKAQGFDWVNQVGNLMTLGSPHHGASLERIGNFVQEIIAKLPFAGSLATLGNLRSAGIIDLRHGSVRDEDWKPLDTRSVLPQDFRHPARLPLHVRSYLIAATLVEGHYDSKATSLLGDGLVNIASALGEDSDAHTLMVPEQHKAIFYGVSHYNLLYNHRVHQQIIQWLIANGQDLLDPPVNISCIHSYPNELSVVI